MENIRAAIQTEIKSVSAELNKLQKMLAMLGDDGGTDRVGNGSVGRRRGRKSKAEKKAAGEADVKKALELIADAGKQGVKAIRLSYMLKGAGRALPSKVDLIGTEKVKMVGKGGASTYVFTG